MKHRNWSKNIYLLVLFRLEDTFRGKKNISVTLQANHYMWAVLPAKGVLILFNQSCDSHNFLTQYMEIDVMHILIIYIFIRLIFVSWLGKKTKKNRTAWNPFCYIVRWRCVEHKTALKRIRKTQFTFCAVLVWFSACENCMKNTWDLCRSGQCSHRAHICIFITQSPFHRSLFIMVQTYFVCLFTCNNSNFNVI